MSGNVSYEFIGALLILIGSIISVISAIGIIRFPDVYSRAHAGTKSSTLAVLLTLTGAFLYIWLTEALISVRLLLGIVFVFLTAPVSGHLIIRAAYRTKVKMSEVTTEDELRKVLYDDENKEQHDHEGRIQ